MILLSTLLFPITCQIVRAWHDRMFPSCRYKCGLSHAYIAFLQEKCQLRWWVLLCPFLGSPDTLTYCWHDFSYLRDTVFHEFCKNVVYLRQFSSFQCCLLPSFLFLRVFTPQFICPLTVRCPVCTLSRLTVVRFLGIPRPFIVYIVFSAQTELCIGYIHLLAIMFFFNFVYPTMSECIFLLDYSA